jgi:ABC-2 type transport system permease protein
LTGDRRGFWDLLVMTSTAAFRNRYVDTVFGFAWMILGPLIGFLVVYVFVTEIIHRFAGRVPNYGVVLLLNIMLFNLFRQGTSGGMRSLVGSAGLLRKMPMPLSVLPLSAVATALYVLAANMVVVIAWILIAGIDPTWTWLLFPVLILGILVITIGMALLLAGLYVRFRDVGMVWPVVTQVLFFTSPVIYPFPLIRRAILWDSQSFNPLAPVLAQARHWIIQPSSPGWFEARGTGFLSFMPFIVLAVIWVLGIVVFLREAPRAAQDV